MKRFQSLLVALLALSMLAGCSSGAAESADTTATADATTATTTDDRTLVLAPYRWVEGWDPHKDWNGINSSRFLVCEGLVTLNENLEVVGLLAQSWEQEDDVTYRFHIYPDIYFTNGNICDAAAIVASLERSLETNDRAGDAKIASVAVDGDDVVITTLEPFSTFLNNLTDYMYYVVDVTDLDNVDVMPVGTGPYMVTDYVPEESYTLEINEQYWGDLPSIENLTVVNIAHDIKVNAVLAGTVDVAQGPTASTVSLAENNSVGVEIITASGIRETDILLNCREGHPLSDSVLREALSYALNRDVLAMISGGNYVEAIDGPFPAGANYGDVDGQSYDVEKALALLAEGGYVDSDGDGYVELLDGSIAEFSLQYDTSLHDTAVAEAIQDMLKQIGFKIVLAPVETISYTPADRVNDDMALDGAACVNAGDGQKFLEAGFTTGGSDNYGGYSDADYDAMIAQLNATFDADARMDLFVDLQQHLIDDSVNLWLYAANEVAITSSRVEGVTLHPLNAYFITTDWTWAE